MTLWAYRDTKAERLVERLAETLATHWPQDPMARVPIVIGSRGMQRWLNHELATLQGSVAAVDFLFPGNAFTRAIAAIHEAAGLPAPADDGAWSGTALHRRVIRALRVRLADPAFDRVRRYLGDCDGPVAARELAFTREVAAVLERLLYDRPDDATAWMADPEAAVDHHWLAQLLADLKVDAPATDPPSRLARLRALPTQQGPAPLFVFGALLAPQRRQGPSRRARAAHGHPSLHARALDRVVGRHPSAQPRACRVARRKDACRDARSAAAVRAQQSAARRPRRAEP